MAKNKRSFVVGVGMTKFEKPLSKKWDYPDMAREAGQKALADCNLKYEQIDAAVVSYCYCDPTAGQRAIYELGLTGIPIFNTNNNCSSASSALMLAKLLVQSGQYHCVMALGFEKMERGLSCKYTDKVDPLQRHYDHMVKLGGKSGPEKHMNEVTANIVKKSNPIIDRKVRSKNMKFRGAHLGST